MIEMLQGISPGYNEHDPENSTKFRGGSRIFFRRGCTRLLLYFNTNNPHFFFGRIPVVLENQRSSQGGGGAGAYPLHPPPRSAPEIYFQAAQFPYLLVSYAWHIKILVTALRL